MQHTAGFLQFLHVHDSVVTTSPRPTYDLASSFAGIVRLQVMALARVKLDAIAATAVMKSYAGETWHPVLALLHEMAGSSIRRDTHLLSAAISACESSCAWKFATQIQQQHVFLHRSLISWNACLAANAAAAMWCFGLGMLHRLSFLSLRKDVVSCSSVLHACDMGHRWQRALKLFSDMSMHGPSPNAIACGAAISAASSSAGGGRWALTTLKNMHLQRLKLSVVCLNAALSACAFSFLWEECMGLLRTMQHDSLSLTMISFGAAMSALERVERWKDALGLLAEAFQAGLQSTLVAASSALAACKHEPRAWRLAIQHMKICSLQSKHARDRRRVFDHTSEVWPPNLIMANTLSSVCESAGQWQQCTEILASLPTWRLRAAQQTYGSIVSSLVASNERGKWQISIGLLNQLRGKDLEMDVIFLGCALSLSAASILGAGVVSVGGPVLHSGPITLLRMVEECGEKALRYSATTQSEGEVVGLRRYVSG